MSAPDPLKNAKVARPKGDKVPASPEAALAAEAAAEEPSPEEKAPEESPPLTDAERAAAEALVPLPAEPVVLPTYVVRSDGRAWYRGQQIRFRKGDTFTAETWDENALAGFRESGVQIERLA